MGQTTRKAPSGAVAFVLGTCAVASVFAIEGIGDVHASLISTNTTSAVDALSKETAAYPAGSLSGKSSRELVASANGVVKWYNDCKGFGFIERVGGEDIFVDREALEEVEDETLEEGDEVEFEIVNGPKV